MTTMEVREAVNVAVEAAGLPYLDMRVVFDAGLGRPELASHADQRDMRRAHVALGCDPDLDPIGFNRACAWACLTRTGVLDIGWADFDRDVAFVIPAEVQTVADPTGTVSAG